MAARSPESFGYPADHLRSSHGDFPPAFLLIISCHCADNDALVTWKGDQLLIRRYLGVPGFSTLREREIDRVALPQRHREELPARCGIGLVVYEVSARKAFGLGPERLDLTSKRGPSDV